MSDEPPNVVSEAGQSALAHLESMSEADPPETASPEAAPEAPEPAPSPEEPSQPAVENIYEFDRAGQRHKLTKAEADYIVNFGLDAYERAMKQKPQAQVQAPQESAQRADANDPTQKLLSRVERLEAQLSEAQTEKQIQTIKGNLDAALGKIELYKELKNPEHQGLLKSLTMLEQYSNPSLSPETAADTATKKLEGLLRDRASAYVEGKVAQAQRRVEKGGNVAASPGGPLGAKDLKNGNVMRSALARLHSMAGQNT